jgi:putative aldouronate transport system substrate-binding protein
MLRGDLLKKHDMEVPTNLTQLEAYLEMLKQEGLIPMTQVSVARFQPCFGPGNIIPEFTADKTGIIPQHLAESYARAVEYFQGLYAKDYIAKEYAMFNDAQAENALVSGKSGWYYKNVWHRFRLNQEIDKVNTDFEITPIFSLEGPDGVSIMYDKGFYGGIMVNSKLDDIRFQKLLAFFDRTSDPDNYFYFMYGIEGRYWNLVDGFPQLTEEGKKDVNNSFYCPYTLATDMYGKVDSPLAPPIYNRETREMVKVVDTVVAKMGCAPFTFFDIISSQSYANFWSLNSTEFNSNVADVITGKKPVSEFRAYQQRLLKDPLVQEGMKEFKQSWDEFGLANWKPPAI